CLLVHLCSWLGSMCEKTQAGVQAARDNAVPHQREAPARTLVVSAVPKRFSGEGGVESPLAGGVGFPGREPERADSWARVYIPDLPRQANQHGRFLIPHFESEKRLLPRGDRRATKMADKICRGLVEILE